MEIQSGREMGPDVGGENDQNGHRSLWKTAGKEKSSEGLNSFMGGTQWDPDGAAGLGAGPRVSPRSSPGTPRTRAWVYLPLRPHSTDEPSLL